MRHKKMKRIVLIAGVALLIGIISLSPKMSLIFLGVTLLILSLLLLHRGVGGVTPPTFALVYFVFYVVSIYLGSFQLFFEHNMDNPKYLIATNLGLVLFPMGVLCANFFLKYQPKKEMSVYSKNPIRDQPYDFKNIALFVILTIIGISVSLMYLQKIPKIPLLFALQSPGEQFEISKAREVATAMFAGKFHRYRFFFADLLPLLSVISFVKATVTSRHKRFWQIMSIGLISFTSFMLLANVQKGPILNYALIFFITLITVKKKLRLGNIILFGVLALIFLGMVYFVWAGLAARGETIGEKLWLTYYPIYRRLIFGQTRGLYWYFKIFPTEHEFLLGQSFPNPGGFLFHKPLSITRNVYSFVYPKSPIVGSMPTVFFGEVYANFGYLAMAMSTFLIGMILQSAQIYFIRSPKTVLMVSFMAFLMIYAKILAGTSLFQVFGIQLLILIIIIGIFRTRIIPSTKN